MDFRKKLILAPLAGVTDTTFRRLCRESGADVVVTEMVSGKGLLCDPRRSGRYLEYDEAERPVGAQLFGPDPGEIAEAAAEVARRGFDFVDLNMGCPVRKVFRADEIARNIEHELGFSHGARDWMQMNRNLFSALKLEKTMMFLLLVLITIVDSFNIVSTLTMIVTEKQKEIAILKAMGAIRRSIRRIFMLNGLIIGFSGTAIGIPLGYAFLWLIERFWTFDASVYYISKIPVHVLAEDVLLVAGSAILISFIATVYPANQAAKLEPVAALRYE